MRSSLILVIATCIGVKVCSIELLAGASITSIFGLKPGVRSGPTFRVIREEREWIQAKIASRGPGQLHMLEMARFYSNVSSQPRKAALTIITDDDLMGECAHTLIRKTWAKRPPHEPCKHIYLQNIVLEQIFDALFQTVVSLNYPLMCNMDTYGPTSLDYHLHLAWREERKQFELVGLFGATLWAPMEQIDDMIFNGAVNMDKLRLLKSDSVKETLGYFKKASKSNLKHLCVKQVEHFVDYVMGGDESIKGPKLAYVPRIFKWLTNDKFMNYNNTQLEEIYRRYDYPPTAAILERK